MIAEGMVHRPARPPRAVGLVLASSCLGTLAAGCGADFDPAYLVTDERVLAIRADPPEAMPGEQVTLTPLVVGPNGALDPTSDYRADWWRCPSDEADALSDEERCSSPDARLPLGEGVPLVRHIEPELSPLPDPDDSEDEAGEKRLRAVFGYWRNFALTMAADGGRVVDAFKRVVVFPSPVPLGDIDPRLADLDVRVNDEGELERNVNPLLHGVEVRADGPDGDLVSTLEPGGRYWLRPDYDEGELQAYASLRIELEGLTLDDPASLRQLDDEEVLERLEKVRRCEVPVFSWFVTGGRLRRDTTVDERVVAGSFAERGLECPPVEGAPRRPEVLFTAPSGDEIPSDGVVHGWLVMRDGRGGTAYTSFDLVIER